MYVLMQEYGFETFPCAHINLNENGLVYCIVED